MKRIFNILMILFIFFTIFSCGSQKKITEMNDNVLGCSMKYALVIEKARTYQVDSLIMADTLPELNRWLGTTFVDDVTNKRTTKRTYIKKYSGKSEIVYIISGNYEPFKIVKRIIE